MLYGRNAVGEALLGRRVAHRLLLAEHMRDDQRVTRILEEAESRTLPIIRVPRARLDEITQGANHQGIALETSSFWYVPLEELLEIPGTILVLDHLQDPQNFGTLMRTADACGVCGVVIPENRAVAVTPSVVNASAGAVEHLRIARVVNLSRALDDLKRAGWWITCLDSSDGATDLYATDVPRPVALVVGAEGSGVGQNVRRRCDLVVRLPMRGKITSLNAATAGSIALYEILRRGPDKEEPVPSSS
ncbi:MAG: 23S rRNA (guanosine(2251)-2'-O)-methyltransferase RlmB [Chloroflexota bacterium]|nr:23S rRNA (guanosine(2251)-2'-O)-methyltransferase RlmB [Chloroflexota bacterium]